MVEFLRDPETGVVYAYQDGTLIGPVFSMGDGDTPPEPSQDLWRREHGGGRRSN